MMERRHIRDLNAITLADLVAEGLRELSLRLRPDVLAALRRAAASESSERGREVLAILIANAEQAKAEQVAPCQDTGSVWLCLTVGSDAAGQAMTLPSDIFTQVDAAVTTVWQAFPLRASMVQDALNQRTNTQSNTPAFYELKLQPGLCGARLDIMVKGAGSDNASALAMLPPGAGWPGIVEFVVAQVAAKAANACPPLLVGVGIGSTFDKVAGLSKQALLREIAVALDAEESQLAQKETELLEQINALGIGPAGLGGDTTALAVHIQTAACHMAALPVAVNLGCCAQRSVSYELEVGA